MKTYILWMFVQNVVPGFMGSPIQTMAPKSMGEFTDIKECTDREREWHEILKRAKDPVKTFTVCLPK